MPARPCRVDQQWREPLHPPEHAHVVHLDARRRRVRDHGSATPTLPCPVRGVRGHPGAAARIGAPTPRRHHRTDTTAAIGTALLASAHGVGYRRIAADIARPLSTVRRRRRSVRGAHRVAVCPGRDTPPRVPARPPPAATAQTPSAPIATPSATCRPPRTIKTTASRRLLVITPPAAPHHPVHRRKPVHPGMRAPHGVATRWRKRHL